MGAVYDVWGGCARCVCGVCTGGGCAHRMCVVWCVLAHRVCVCACTPCVYVCVEGGFARRVCVVCVWYECV